MKVIKGKKRIMQEEFLAKGITKKTAEVRETYDLLTFRSNISYMPSNETQRPHRHILVSEAVHVLAGQIEVRHANHWQPVVHDQVALFELNEVHNIRTTNLNEGVIYAGIREDVAAIAVVYKWIAPFFEIYEDENQFCT